MAYLLPQRAADHRASVLAENVDPRLPADRLLRGSEERVDDRTRFHCPSGAVFDRFLGPLSFVAYERTAIGQRRGPLDIRTHLDDLM